jgi:putative peptide zinc metalloprotease protein
VYFNTIFILLTAGAYFLTGFEPLLLIIPLQHMEILHQFLPFIRLDGYYIVSDLTGVPDMFMRIKPVLKSLLPWRETEDSVKELKTWARAAVTVYVLTLIPALALLLGLTLMNLPRVFGTAYDSFVTTAHKLGHAGGASIVVDVIQLVVLLLVPLGLVVTFVQLGRKALVGSWRVTDGRPAARVLLLSGVGAAAAFAGYTWFPSSSVYKPIQPNERGTLGGAVGQVTRIPSGRPAAPQHAPSPVPKEQGAPAKGQTSTTSTTTGSSTTSTTAPGATTRATTTTSGSTTTAGTATGATTTAPADTATTPTTATTATVPTATTEPATTTTP